MSSAIMINLAFDDFSRAARGADERRERRYAGSCDEISALRIALRYGEQLRVPDASKRLHLLSGTAWVSSGGRDYVLDDGDCLSVSRAKGGAIISPLREEPILFELS
jgi:hypothetical protein